MSIGDRLAQERRARLAAERLLELKQRELFAANSKLALHARALGEQVREQRQNADTARSEADLLRGEQVRFLDDLEKAHTAAISAERRLWDSVETIEDGFAVFDADQTLVSANSAWLSIFDGMEEVRPGISLRELAKLIAQEGIIDTEGLTPSEFTESMVSRWEEDPVPPRIVRLWNGGHIRLVDRRTRGGDMVCLALNITESVAREVRLKDAQQRAEEASRAKSRFLANMGHELRTPLNGIVGMAELLKDTPLTEDQRIYAETIRSSGEALLAIIEDVLDFTKIEAEKVRLRPEPFDLERAIHEVIMLVRPGVQGRDIQLMVDFDVFLPTRFNADAGRFRQVLMNLVGNAVKFTENGHVLVRVAGTPAGPGLCRLQLTVEDTGIGIDPGHQAVIFEQFSQVEDAANRRFGGTGLGLAITRQIIDLMGGELWVESRKGEGSCFGFRVTLPVAEGEPVAPPSLTGRRVLVVDDLMTTRTMLERQLAALGARIVTCRSGADAMAAMGEEHFDLVILDEKMPDGSGLALARRMVEAGRPAPGIVLLASHPTRLRAEAGDLPLIGVLAKPVLRSELFACLSMPAPPFAPAKPPRQIRPVDAPRRMRVLTAEDNRTNQLVFGKMVKDLAIDLEFARNGLDAVEKYESFRPDLIFMDISMPELDGREATRRIRQSEQASGRSRTTIIALTAHTAEAEERLSLAAGIDRYLTKPLRKSLIIDCLAEHRPALTFPLQPTEMAAE